jgi:FkbM family methyltransferase
MKPSRFAEFIMGGLLPDSAGKRPGGVQRRIFMRMRRSFSGDKERLFRFNLCGSEILLPLAHDLALIRAGHPQYSSNIARLCAYVAEKYPDLHVIDIGANVGDTAAIIRELSQCPILCVEGDEYYYSILAENIRRAKMPSVQAVRAFVATYTGEIEGQLVSGGGTAHFVENKADPIKTVKLSDLLKDFPGFQSSKMLKIDTDGFDCSILRSELEWLGERKPVIFFEYDPFFFQNQAYDGTRIFADLATVGYRSAIFYDNLGDYLCTLDLQRDESILTDLQRYYTGRRGLSYPDVAVFHEEDSDLCASIRTRESEWCVHRQGRT